MGQDHFFFVFSMHTKMYIGICLASRNLYVIIDLVSLILAQNEIFLNGAQKEIWKVQWALHIDKPHPTKRWKVKTTPTAMKNAEKMQMPCASRVAGPTRQCPMTLRAKKPDAHSLELASLKLTSEGTPA